MGAMESTVLNTGARCPEESAEGTLGTFHRDQSRGGLAQLDLGWEQGLRVTPSSGERPCRGGCTSPVPLGASEVGGGSLGARGFLNESNSNMNTHEKVHNSLSHEGTARRKHEETPLHTHCGGSRQRPHHQHPRGWGATEPSPAVGGTPHPRPCGNERAPRRPHQGPQQLLTATHTDSVHVCVENGDPQRPVQTTAPPQARGQ